MFKKHTIQYWQNRTAKNEALLYSSLFVNILIGISAFKSCNEVKPLEKKQSLLETSKFKFGKNEKDIITSKDNLTCPIFKKINLKVDN
jgi:hypothetical protein